GPAAKAVYEGLQKRFESAPRLKDSILSEVVMAAYQQLRQAYSQDQIATFDPGPIPDVKGDRTKTQIPAKTEFFTQEGSHYKLAGLPGDHLLYSLLKAVGLNPDNFSAKVADVLHGSATSTKYSNLDSAPVWLELARKLRGIAASDGSAGGPKADDIARALKNEA